jgi:hypothetical protein
MLGFVLFVAAKDVSLWGVLDESISKVDGRHSDIFLFLFEETLNW